MSDIVYNQKNAGISPEDKQNFFKNSLGMIFSPNKTLERITQRPKILSPFLFMLFGASLPLLINHELFFDTLRKTLEKFNNSNNIILTSEEFENRILFSFKTAVLTAPITTIVTWIVFATLLFGLVRAFNGQGTYKQILSITGHAYIIKYIFLILSLICSVFTRNLQLDLSLGKFVEIFSLNLNPFAVGLLEGLSFFRIWEYIVVGIGVFWASKLDKSRVYLIIIIQLVLYLIYSGVSQLLSSTFLNN